MNYSQSTITQDEYDALKITLAARDAEIKRMRSAQIDRLLDLVEAAYMEGFCDSVELLVENDLNDPQQLCWEASKTYDALLREKKQ